MILFESWQNEAETRAAMGKLRPCGIMQPAELFSLAVFVLEEMLGITMFFMIHYFPPLHLLLLQLLCPIIEPIVAHQSKSFPPSVLEPCCFKPVFSTELCAYTHLYPFLVFIPIHPRIFYFELSTSLLLVEGDPGAISNPDGYQDALSKKQRRPQDEERRRKEQGPSVRSHKLSSVGPDLLKILSVAFAYKRLIISLLRYK